MGAGVAVGASRRCARTRSFLLLMRRIARRRRTRLVKYSVRDKRDSGGTTHCTCRGSCSTKMCGCVKAGNGCGSGCRCQPALCKNKKLSSTNASDSEEKENTPTSVLDTTPPSYFGTNLRPTSPESTLQLTPIKQRERPLTNRSLRSNQTQKWMRNEKYSFYKNLSGIWHIFKKKDGGTKSLPSKSP
ncbi:chromosome-associated kinesin KIF4-like isoform X2 [Cydia fagiglandana]|uniref:chromosome-associated kinesin KIF4-like isoform X2 n=1 Tax=Cydia fagiglandana TaxID=1458189 RepID=UPI002FEE5AD2